MSKLFLNSTTRIFILLSLIVFFAAVGVKADDPSPEEIVAKHLASIGTKENLKAEKNRMAVGVSDFKSKFPSRQTAGKFLIASKSNADLMFLSGFNSKEYPFEKIGLFADKIVLPFVTAGTRSPLGAFVNDHNKIISQGVFAGTVSTTWALANAPYKKEKFSSAGTKKIDGRRAYVLNYFTGDSPDFSIKFFFDAETFRHVRTEYLRNVPAQTEVFGTLGRQTGVKISLTETFGDYKTAGNLTLPHSYRIKYVTDSNSGVYEYEWDFAVAEYRFDQNLAADFFKFDEK